MWLAPLPLMGSETAGAGREKDGFRGAITALPPACYVHRYLGPGFLPRASDVANLEVRNIPRGGGGVGLRAQICRGNGGEDMGKKRSCSFIALP